MTCLIGVASPARSGMTLDGGAPAVRTLLPSLKPLLATTCWVYVASWAALGTAIWDSVPTIMDETYWLGGPEGWFVYGLGPSVLGPAPRPLALSTSDSWPSSDRTMAVGYQAVGIRPFTLSCPCLAPSWMTATSSFSELTT